MSYGDNDGCSYPIIGFFILIIFVLSLIYLQAAFEANAYKNVTGKEVSVWDAMFLDLRVQSEPKD